MARVPGGSVPAGLGEAPTWAPDGKRIAFVSSKAGLPALWIMNANGTGRRAVELPEPPSNAGDDWPYTVLFPAWSPDGRTIAFSNGMSLWAVEVESGEVAVSPAAPAGTACSRRGRRTAAWSRTSTSAARW